MTGDQPLYSGPLTLIANGEIYNYIELKEAAPGDYSTASDCEPPLKFFARASADYASKLRGMYAIAIHDRAFRTLTLSRDVFGIKPLYVAKTENGLVFASEPQALLDAGVPREIERQKLHELLNLQFCTGSQSIFPASSVSLRARRSLCGTAKSPPRSSLAFPTPEPAPINEAEALARLDAVLENAVDLHQRSDVPYGMFLSGGIDSAAILAMMARLNSLPRAGLHRRVR